MSDHGFIDPDQPTRERIDRIEILITEALSQLTIEDLSPEAQAILADLRSVDEVRRERALRRLHAAMDADPLPEGTADHG
jgi:hypothetical protein